MARVTLVASKRGQPIHVRGDEADSQSFVKGDLVVRATGSITVATDGVTSILGIADTPATNVTADHIEMDVLLLEPGDEIAIDTYESTPGAAKGAALFTKGKAYGLLIVSGVPKADFDDTTNDLLIFERPVPNLDGSTSYRGLFRVKAACLQGEVGE